MRKQTTAIIERNGGVHKQKALRRIESIFDGHGFIRPRLYHLILMAETDTLGAKRYLSALKALRRKLREEGISIPRWRAALELDDEKGLHFHVFLLFDATAKNPCEVINTKPDGWLRSMLDRKKMTFHLSKPKADMHRVGGTLTGKRKNYASLAGDKLDDCKEWISYLAKARSKPEHITYLYFSSRDSKHRPRDKKTGNIELASPAVKKSNAVEPMTAPIAEFPLPQYSGLTLQKAA